MTPRSSARLAGAMFLAYIATGLTQMAAFSSLTSASGDAATTLNRLAAHPVAARIDALLSLLQGFEAILLGAALFALTRDVDRDLAVIAFACRLAEGVVNAISAGHDLSLLGVATSLALTTGATRDATTAIGAYLLRGTGTFVVSALCFAVGSTLFAWLFVRARSIPRWLAQLGVAASVLLVVLLPLQMLGVVGGVTTTLMWLPMLVFEVVLAGVLILRGPRTP